MSHLKYNIYGSQVISLKIISFLFLKEIQRLEDISNLRISDSFHDLEGYGEGEGNGSTRLI